MPRFRRLLSVALLAALATSGMAVAADSGVDLKGIDHSVKPGDNFFDYANGSWLKTAQIPADRAETGTFLTVYELAEKRTAELIQNAAKAKAAPGSNPRKIADFYAAYMDEAAIEQHGLTPLQPQLDAIAAIKTRSDLSRVLGSEQRADVDPVNDTNFHTEHLFGAFVTQGLEDPDHSIAYLLQGGLAMPSRDYYLSTDKDMVEARAKYHDYVVALLKLANTPDAEAQAKLIIDLETKIAQAQESLVDSQDVHKANNIWPMNQFASKAPGIDWSAYFKAAGLADQSRIDVWQPGATTKLAALVGSEPLESWKTLLRFHALDAAAPLLPKPYAQLSFQFYGTTLEGTPQQQPRWKRAVAATNRDLGDAVGEIYVQKYFPADARATAQAMVKNLVEAFDSRLDTLTWMTPATRAKAKEKIKTLKVGVGYGDSWRSYASLEVKADDPLGNHQRAVLLEYQHQMAKLHQPVDRSEWWMTPQTVNAVNLPLQNALNFPAAILQPPFFDPQRDPASNYGAIGAIIGHEISHSFDNTGADFDAQGRMLNWWTPTDAKHFEDATQMLVKQFSAYEALPGLHVNGQQTLGENIADVSGLTAAYLAYRHSLGGKEAPVIDGLTGDQRFFLAFGQAWRAKMRDAALRQTLATDVHAPPQFRALTVRNLDAWYDAFKVQPGEKLYLAPDQRVKIW